MASIAYVSDKDMLEYHRLNGNKTINFWRTSTKSFTGFKPGDLLFFLSKRPEDLKNKEKGIIGYGCLAETRSMSCSRMWKTYGDENGFASKKELEEAIRRIAKGGRLPERISCLVLKDVQFFQGAVYLSEFGVKINSNLESFTYLDSDEYQLTLEILKKAREIGLDSWAANQGTKTDDGSFEKELLKYQIASVFEYIGLNRKPLDPKLASMCYQAHEANEPLWVNAAHGSFLVTKPEARLYVMYHSKQKEQDENYLRLLGSLVYVMTNLRQQGGARIGITVLSPTVLSEDQRKVLEANDIQYENVLK